jgi:DNA-binding MarR family transcriptional regulator
MDSRQYRGDTMHHMATAQRETVVPADIIGPLEQLMFEAIGMTTIALAASASGELTLSGWRALVILDRADKTRVGTLAQGVGMSLPSASRLVRRLERDGLVMTERDESDRRATLVSLTRQGHELRGLVIARRRALMDEALATEIPKLPRDLVPGLTAIARAFEAYS